jgi:hypothetical protein
MKYYFSRLLFLAGLLVMASSCEKDETQVVLTLAETPVLTTSTTNAGVLLAANSGDALVTYSWTPLTFNVSSDTKTGVTVAYTIEMARPGSNFAAPASLEAGTGSSITYKVGDINSALVQAGLTPGISGQVDVRLKASYAPNTPSPYSNATTLTATPYSRELYAFGSFQGTPNVATAPFIQITPDNPQQYDGYLYMPNATNTFKLSNTNTPSGTIYGSGSAPAGSPNSFAANGGDISLTGPGQYRLQVNLANSSYTATEVSWGIIGSATPNGWANSTPLTLDTQDQKWKGRVVLTAGGAVKFRANNAWDINLGADATGKMSYGGPDISSPGAGEYDVVLDLTKPNAYTYTFTKR